MAIVWTKYWSGSDDGTVLRGIDIRNIQDDLANVTDASLIGVTVQAYDEDLDALSNPEVVNSANLVTNGAFDTWPTPPTPSDWTVEGGGTEAQNSTEVQVGSYSYKITSDADGSASRQTVYSTISATENTYWRGKQVTLTARVYTSVTNNARIRVDDGVDTTTSTYHTGTVGWETLSVTHTMSATATKLDVVLLVDGNAQNASFDAVRLNNGSVSWEFIRHPGETTTGVSNTFTSVHLTEASAPTTLANEGALYTKDVSGVTELFYREDSSGDEIQLTNNGYANSLGIPNNISVFTSSGTWTRPSNVDRVYVKVWGAGGAGADGAAVGSYPGGGGGGGGYSEGFTAVTGNVTVTVGTGGTTDGANGGTSSFAGTTTIQATGGNGASSQTGGSGGVGSNGTINLTGGTGASSEVIQGNDIGTGGGGGGSPMGGAGGPGGLGSNAGGNAGTVGTPGVVPGGGGGGGGTGDGESAHGDGADGLVIVYY